MRYTNDTGVLPSRKPFRLYILIPLWVLLLTLLTVHFYSLESLRSSNQSLHSYCPRFLPPKPVSPTISSPHYYCFHSFRDPFLFFSEYRNSAKSDIVSVRNMTGYSQTEVKSCTGIDHCYLYTERWLFAKSTGRCPTCTGIHVFDIKVETWSLTVAIDEVVFIRTHGRPTVIN